MRIRILAMGVTLSALMLPLTAQPSGPEEVLAPLPEVLLDAYFSQRPEGFLVDPQQILRGRAAREQREFLEYHSGDSIIDLCVLLFRADQQLPGERAREFARTWFAEGKDTVVVLYPMGQPERAEIQLSPRLELTVPLAEQERALTSSVERALTEGAPPEQFDKFIVQMAIRIYRMEHLLEEGSAGPAPVLPEAESRPPAEERPAARPWQPLMDVWHVWRLQIAGGLLAAAAAWWYLRRRRRLARHLLPEWDYEERLGGPHGAGVGALVSFSKNSPPPAAQRERL